MTLLKYLVLATLCQPISSTKAADDYRYNYEIIATDLIMPMTMAMAPDGRIFFNELTGKLRLLDPKTKLVKEVGELKVFTEQESGFLGFALDPEFKENGHIFVQQSLVDYDGQAVIRYTIKEDVLDHSSAKELLRWPVQRRECCHHAGAVRFGPDGNLFISTGDNTSPFASDGFTPIDERDDRAPFDAQKSSGNTNDLRGKILRIRPTPDGSYTIPEGNLFKSGSDKTRAEIYAMGFRNPWRFQVDQRNGIVYSGDVGPDSGNTNDDRGPNGFDTINQIRKPAHFGWPYSRGKEVYHDYDFEKNHSGEPFSKTTPINSSPNNTGLSKLPPVEPPMIWYPAGGSNEFPMLGTGGRTACAGPVFYYEPGFSETDGFPQEFDGHLLVYDWHRPFMVWAKLDGSANFKGLVPFTSSARIAQGDDNGSGQFQIKRPVDGLFGPDGCLYLMDYGETWGVNPDARMLKISYQRGNLPPLAKASLKNAIGKAPLTIAMSADGSKDIEGKELSYEWLLQPGDQSLARSAQAETTIKEDGNYQIELRVTDPDGASSRVSHRVTVGNTSPVVTFLKPQEGDFFELGAPLEYKIKVEDAEDGTSTDGPKASQISAATLVSNDWLNEKNQVSEEATGMKMMKQSDCFNCHAVDKKLVGPGLLEIADRYRGQAGAVDVSTDRVLKGSAGVWGEVPMLPHPQHTKDELHMMVEWIFSLEAGKTGPSLMRGTEGAIEVPDNQEIRGGRLQADFTDFGAGKANPVSAKTIVNLRGRFLEAEMADELLGPQPAGFQNASGKKAIGNISSGHALRISNVNLITISSITISYAVPDEEKKIEIRKGSRDGKKIGEFLLKPTGGWETWSEANTEITPDPERGDLFFIFSNALNLDWIRFNK
ncbi:MAG: PQQ-dependent sugar dehydrogenase [Armatimonadetes bacterium]|nr:PQQ-dependent sugar dehydrogenase [Akkermansiaceae bacterium]